MSTYSYEAGMGFLPNADGVSEVPSDEPQMYLRLTDIMGREGEEMGLGLVA